MKKLKIGKVKRLLPSQEKRLFHWSDDVFGGAHLNLEWQWQPVLRFVAFRRWRVVSHVGLFYENVEVGGENRLSVGGIGGVATVPRLQGRGYARALMNEAERYCTAQDEVDFLLLFCQDHLLAYYESMGYVRITEPVTISQSDGMRTCPINVLYLRLSGEQWPAGLVRIDALPW